MKTFDTSKHGRALRALLAIGALAGLGGGAFALADRASLDPAAYPVTHEQAVEVALASVPGRVVGTELEDEDGVIVWEVEVVGTDGIERELYIDASTAEVLEIEEEDD